MQCSNHEGQIFSCIEKIVIRQIQTNVSLQQIWQFNPKKSIVFSKALVELPEKKPEHYIALCLLTKWQVRFCGKIFF